MILKRLLCRPKNLFINEQYLHLKFWFCSIFLLEIFYPIDNLIYMHNCEKENLRTNNAASNAINMILYNLKTYPTQMMMRWIFHKLFDNRVNMKSYHNSVWPKYSLTKKFDLAMQTHRFIFDLLVLPLDIQPSVMHTWFVYYIQLIDLCRFVSQVKLVIRWIFCSDRPH